MLTDTNQPADALEPPAAAAEPAPATVSVNGIPGEMGRPAFVVLDEFIEEGSSKYRPGVWHFGIKQSRGGDGPPTLTQRWICSPLHIDAVTHDPHKGNFGRLLRFQTTLGEWVTWAMPMEMLRGDGADVRGVLLSMGVQIDPHARNMLGVYLQDRAPKRRIECALQTGWAGTEFQAFVLPDRVIGPKASSVAYQSDHRSFDEYTQRGTLHGWQAGTAAMAVDNPLLALALCAAFAGPVLARVNMESGGLHLIGDSSTGKTTALEAACSIWGGANYRRSWRTTSNGLEGAAALFNDSLLALDEISECDPRAVGEVVYMLGNGRGKQRAGRTGGARTVTRWRSSVLSTGERSIATTMIEGGHRVKAGQAVRVLDIPAQRTHGAWDNLHGHASGTAFSDTLKREAARHYGHAGRAFLEKLTRDTQNFSEALDALKALPGLQAPGGEGQASRAAARLAVLALAGELATAYGVTGWTQGEATRAAEVAFAAWLSLRGNASGNAEHDQIAERVLSFIERHGDSRFSDVDGTDDQRAGMVRDRAGWWEDRRGIRIFLFTGDGLREALKGFDFHRALDALQLARLIPAPGADGKKARTKRISGRAVKVYAVHPEGIPSDTAGLPPSQKGA